MRLLQLGFLVALASALAAILIYVTGVSDFYYNRISDENYDALESLQSDFRNCVVQNSTTILTKEYIDALPNGWEEYAWRRINKGVLLNLCQIKILCVEKLSLVLPETPAYSSRQFGWCAVIGNSGDLLKTKFGKEIDNYDVVIRENGAPIQDKLLLYRMPVVLLLFTY